MPLLRLRKPGRSPAQQLLLLALAGVFGLALLLGALSWASGIATSDSAVDPNTGTVTLALAAEPPTLDSTQASSVLAGYILDQTEEGLLRHDAHGHIVPGVAEKWTITATGATFWLRPDAKWSDGKPVTAHDFVFAWRLVVDPARASPYAFIMDGLKNAAAIVAGRMPPSALGVEAIGDRELRVEFAHPMPYFAELATFGSYDPVRRDFYESTHGTYAADADKLLYNGPYTITTWVHGAHLTLHRNPYYWNRQSIQVKTIDFPYFTTDPGTLVNLFRDGKIAFASLSASNLKEAQLLRWNIRSAPSGGVVYVGFNFRAGRITGNLDFRRAVQYTLSPDELVNKIVKAPGQVPALSLFPSWLEGVNGRFRREYPPEKIVPDPVKARHYLALAKQQLGIAEFPPITLLTFDAELSNRAALYYQNKLKTVLGLDIRIDQQTAKQVTAKLFAGQFDMFLASWYPDYEDPLTFGNLLASSNANNYGRFHNPALDAEVAIASSSNDRATRMRAFAAIQHILIDQAAVIPGYEPTRLFVVNPGIKGLVFRVTGGQIDLTHLRFTGK